MKKISALLLAALLCLSLAACGSRATPQQPAITSDGQLFSTQPILGVAGRLNPSLLAEETQNVLYSPTSLYYTLALLATGAAGETAAEMRAALGLGDIPAEDFAGALNNLYANTWFSQEEQKMFMANSLWLQNNYELLPEFTRLATQYFAATTHNVDFTKPSTARQMNDWVSDNTEGLLQPDYASSPPPGPLTLLNTVFLADAWASPFNKNITDQRDFHLPDGSAVPCDFMTKTSGNLAYANTGKMQAVSISLANGGHVLFAMPRGSFNNFISSFDPTQYEDPDDTLSGNAQVTVHLPKFSFGTSYESNVVQAAFENLGIRKAFSADEANFSNMTGAPEGLFIGTILHDATITVSESGLQAAAATRVDMVPMAGQNSPTKQVEITFDKPFLFVVYASTGLPLFLGRCNNPTLS